jgi:hypothetical protein
VGPLPGIKKLGGFQEEETKRLRESEAAWSPQSMNLRAPHLDHFVFNGPDNIFLSFFSSPVNGTVLLIPVNSSESPENVNLKKLSGTLLLHKPLPPANHPRQV